MAISLTLANGYRCLVMLGSVFALGSMSVAFAIDSPSKAGRFVPPTDSQVLEVLAPKIKKLSQHSNTQNQTQNTARAIEEAKQAILLARSTSDPRFLGRAQALLGRLWDQTDAPVDAIVMQATIEQSRHDFDAAKKSLARALKSSPNHAQAWLTLATLHRVSGDYVQALSACKQVASGSIVFSQACELETASMLGQFELVHQKFNVLIVQLTDPATKAWLHSLYAESLERFGDDSAAQKMYQSSLRLEPDVYTSLALADLSLRLHQPKKTLSVLALLPDSDAIILRRAYALKQMGDTSWRLLAKQLDDRIQAVTARGDDSSSHAREQALTQLWLYDQPLKALTLALKNLEKQREPIDWWIALISAQLANEVLAKTRINSQLLAVGLVDQRLKLSKQK
jgi:tetratricopeptide (TPR) repeat protein